MPLSKIDSDSLNTPITAVDLAYTGTLTGGTGVVNLGSGQVYKDASGNVVFGATSATYSAAGRVSVEVNGATDSVFAARTGGTARAYIQATSTQVNMYTASAIPLTLGTDNNERARIDSSGNLLVGTTTRSNDEKLTVFQSGSAMGISVRTTGGPALGNYESSDGAHATFWTFGRDNAVTGNYVFAYGGTLRGSISNSTGTYTASSDSRLKKNITNMTYGLSEVMAMRPVTYLMNEEPDTAKKHLGFIAQEVKALIDESVDDLVDPDKQFYMMDKGGLVPVLVKAIQELKAIVDAQGAEIAALKGTP